MKKIINYILLGIIFITPITIKAEENNIIRYSSHVQSIGWQDYVNNGELSGTTGKSKRLESFIINKNIDIQGNILYRSYVEDIGWQDYVTEGNISGTTGQSKRIEMIQVKLTEDLSEQYDIYYRVHVSNVGWLDWANNNQITGTLGYNYSIEALEIKLIKKGDTVPENTTNIYKEKPLEIKYKSHLSNIGWQNYVKDGELSGTTGQSKRIESFIINKTNTTISGDILYRSYVEDIGWQDYVTEGNISGTTGQSKRIEMIQVKLTEELAEQYDIYYRVHVSNIGWLDWAHNDQITGSLGYNYSIEALEIKLIKKGDTVPENTINIYKEKPLEIKYKSHVSNIGWQNYVKDGELSGTTGKSKKIESFMIDKLSTKLSGNILYRSYVEDIGWQDYVTEGNISGTTGQSKRIEMIGIKLTDELSEQYDIYYRVHVSNIGWLDWAKNGEITGTYRYGYSIEALEIKLIKKGDKTPDNVNKIYLENDVNVRYQSFYNNKWQTQVSNGETSGTVGQSTPIKSFKVTINNNILKNWVKYRSYINGRGWQDYKDGNNVSGTTDNNKYLEMIQIDLSEEAKEEFNIYYRVHVSNIGWLDWTSNGEITGTKGYGYSIEAIEIKILKKEDDSIAVGEDFFREKSSYLTYTTHIESNGWLDYSYDLNTSGKIKLNKKIELLKINLNSLEQTGNIKYSVHVEDYGWLDYVDSGEIAGITLESKRIEAIKIELEGSISELYDIYYRTYIEDIGWLDWAKNGETAGSMSISKKMLGIQITLVEKDKEAPGKTGKSYTDSIFIERDGKTYYYEKGNYVTGFKTINNTKYFFNSEGVLMASNVKKVIDVSSHQNAIDWSSVKKDGVDGAIIRLGYGTSYANDYCVFDTTFEQNYYATRDLGMLSGIYLYSYAVDTVSATIEANFVVEKLNKYNVDKNIPFYYDLEENRWTTNLYSPQYYEIVKTFSDILEQNGYTAKVYSYKFWAENRFDVYVKSKLDWIAQYNDYCTYNGTYKVWQYTSSGRINGISGDVDISIWQN